MKQFNNLTRYISAVIIVLFLLACQKEMSKLAPKTVELEDPVPGNSSFIITSENVTETADGLSFNGSLSTKTDEGEEYLVAEGDFKIVKDDNGAVKSFTGIGKPQFPKVGLFAEMLKTFTWKFIKAHIEYEKGSYYIDKYKTDLPLNPEQKYLHYKVFDDRDGEFTLANVGNQIFYYFNDMYIDPLDPAVVVKAQLFSPTSPATASPANVVTGFWSKAKSALATIAGSTPLQYASGPQLAIGMSNQAKFTSQPFPFKVLDKEAFKSYFGFNAFEAMPSHYYFRMKGIPIPATGILRFHGDAYVHLPFKSMIPEVSPRETIEDNYKAVLDWINNEETNGHMVTMNGTIDPGGKGIGAILTGLKLLNGPLGREVFGEDFDINLVSGTLQFQVPGINQIGSGQVPSFLRLGLELKTPMLNKILGPDIRKYLFSEPSPSCFFYFSLGPTADEASLYTEASLKMDVPLLDELDLGHSMLAVSKNGIELTSGHDIEIGPLNIESSLKGKISPEGFSLHAKIDNNITLPGDIELTAQRLEVNVDSKAGVEVEGEVVLPFGLGEANMKGSITKNEVALSGSLRAGTEIDLGNGLRLPTANMKFAFSSNPAKGLELEGEVKIPYVGFVSVKGKVNKNDFLLEGKAGTAQLVLGNTTLPYVNGSFSISKASGLKFSAEFNLGPFGSRSLAGSISATDINLTGKFNTSITIGGHTFTFANATANLDKNGVKISGLIDLYVFKMQMAGTFISPTNFTLTGQFTHNLPLVKATYKATLTPTNIALSATGTIYGPLGGELFSGTLKVVPNWATKSINVCYTSLGQEICLGL